jgi:chemotaxis signal transduction protein
MDTQDAFIVADNASGSSTINAGRRATARLIEYAHSHQIALPPHTTLELVESPMAVAVPGAAYFAHGLLAWQGRWIPMIDLEVLLLAHQEVELVAAPRYALIVAYQRAPRRPLEYGAISLYALPQTIEIGDETCCELPTDSDLWPLLALSCFRHEGHAVPILDPARLFSAYHG